jgi:acyl-[acyl-carrier-protein]-phospholipid O-acyltransferase/long-chain-fatty-acid--[acyl-carrier-protein] ligase
VTRRTQNMLSFLRWLLRLLYGFSAHNEGGAADARSCVASANHLSWWDWLLIGVCLEEDWRFVTSSTSAELSWVHKRIMANHRTFPVDMNSPFAVKHMAEYLKKRRSPGVVPPRVGSRRPAR